LTTFDPGGWDFYSVDGYTEGEDKDFLSWRWLMKKLMMTIAVVALLSTPVLAGPPTGVDSGATVARLRQKLTELKKEKARALSTHVLEAELMKEVKRGSLPPADQSDSRLASRESK